MDPGDNDEPSREELESRVEQLEQTVSKMLPDRRGVIKGLGAAAIGGAAVGGATGGASGQSAAGQIGTESEPVDVEGAQGNFNSVNTDELNSTYTRVSVGDDLQTRYDETPNGGTLFFEAGIHDIANLGTVTIDRPISVEFAGGAGRTFDFSQTAYIDNTGTDAVAGPIIDVDGGAGSNFINTWLKNINIVHHGSNAAIRVNEPGTYVHGGFVQCDGVGEIGLKMDQYTYSTAISYFETRDYQTAGILHLGEGGGKFIFNCKLGGGVDDPGSPTAWSLDVNPGDKGDLTLMNSRPDSVRLAGIGHTIINNWFEANGDYALQFGTGTDAAKYCHGRYNEFQGSYQEHPVFFKNTESCAVRPDWMSPGANTGDAARFGANSVRDAYVAKRQAYVGKTFDIDTGAVDPLASPARDWIGNDALRDSMNPTAGATFFNSDDNNLNIYNGTEWILPDGSAT